MHAQLRIDHGGVSGRPLRHVPATWKLALRVGGIVGERSRVATEDARCPRCC